jgi:NAD(P)-dependent dehydrogenase (short-subunit alcohol dehydrogenase family)
MPAEDKALPVALVTGASRGIGRSIALCLARQGCDVGVNYQGDVAAAGEVMEQIRALGRRAVLVQGDVSLPDEAPRLVALTEAELGPLRVLVNNVGPFFFRPLTATTERQWREVLDGNLSSVFYLCRAAIPGMRARRYGRIVNLGLSPAHTIRAATNIAAYAIAKTGVLILTRTLAAEEAHHGITVNCVSPGLIDNGHLPPAQREWMEQRVPTGRLGQPDDVANAVAFLVSGAAEYISGANLAVAGAWDWEDRPTAHDPLVEDLFTGDLP